MRKLLIPLISITLCGCTYQEVHEKAYLRSVSISENSDNSMKNISMNFYNDDCSPTNTTTQTLDTVLQNSEIISGKSIFTGHTEIIVLGECDYIDTLEFMIKEWKVSPSCLVIYGGDNADNIVETMDCSQLSNIIKIAVKQHKIPQNDIITVLSDLLQNNQTDIPQLTLNGSLQKITISCD